MATPREIETLSGQHQAFADDIADGIRSQMGPIQRRIFNRILRELEVLTTGADDKFRMNKANSARLQRLIRELEEIILTGDYVSSVQAYSDSLEQVAANLVELHVLANGRAMSLDDLMGIVEAYRIEVDDKFIGDGLRSNIIQPIKEKITKAVLSGQDSQGIEDELRVFIEGVPGNLGELERYVSQMSVDIVNQFQGTMDQAIMNAFGYEWIMYIGSIIDTSRPQCKRWRNRKYLHVSELEREIGNSSNSGMIPGTNASNFLIYRGGYRCRHTAVSVDSSLVPLERRAQFV